MTRNPIGAQYLKAQTIIAGVILVFLVLFGLDLDPEQRLLVFPVLAIGGITIVLFLAIWNRDGAPPIFDIGIICVTVTAIYVGYPILAFLLSGSSWTPYSDSRLQMLGIGPIEVAKIGWWGVAYLLPLSITYLVFRKHAAIRSTAPLELPSKAEIGWMVALFVLIGGLATVVKVIFGVDFNPTYGSESVAVGALPLGLQQSLGKAIGIGRVLQFGLILILVRKSETPSWRYLLWAWAGLEVITTLVTLGARSGLVFFLFAWILAYHRAFQPLKPVAMFALAATLIPSILLYGFVRDLDSAEFNLETVLSASNEFQSLLGTGIHMMYLRDVGGLGDPPWQLYFADVLRPIPQQLLPFDKVDQGEWYLDLIGLRGSGVGFMFGVISEAAVGFGAIELIARGVVLGLVLAAIHNWYARRATSFWATLFYLWLCTWIYYSFRASTFYLLAHVLTIYIPTYIIIWVLAGRRRFVAGESKALMLEKH